MSVGFQLSVLTIACLVLGIFVSIKYLKRKSLLRKVSYLDGFVSWLLFVLSALILNVIFMPFLRGVGDNPTAAIGATFAFLLSFILNPLIWFWIRGKDKKPY